MFPLKVHVLYSFIVLLVFYSFAQCQSLHLLSVILLLLHYLQNLYRNICSV